MFKPAHLAAALSLAAVHAAPAAATTPVSASGIFVCGRDDIAPIASACIGWLPGNLNGGSSTMRTVSALALNALLGRSDLTGSTLSFRESLDVASGSVIDFATPLFGDTVFSVHVGAAKGQASGVGYQGTAFYRFDAGNLAGGLDKIRLNIAGLSNARLYSTGQFATAVPEPATWATMIAGFMLAGAGLRRRRAAGPAAALA